MAVTAQGHVPKLYIRSPLARAVYNKITEDRIEQSRDHTCVRYTTLLQIHEVTPHVTLTFR